MVSITSARTASLACFLLWASAGGTQSAYTPPKSSSSGYGQDITTLSFPVMETGCTKDGRRATMRMRVDMEFQPQHSLPPSEAGRLKAEIRRTLGYTWRQHAGSITLSDFLDSDKSIDEVAHDIGVSFVVEAGPRLRGIRGTGTAHYRNLEIEDILITREQEPRCARHFAGPSPASAL